MDDLYLCGGVIKNPSTLRVIEDTLGERIKVANPFENMRFNERLYTRDALNDLALESAVAVGLALRRTVE